MYRFNINSSLTQCYNCSIIIKNTLFQDYFLKHVFLRLHNILFTSFPQNIPLCNLLSLCAMCNYVFRADHLLIWILIPRENYFSQSQHHLGAWSSLWRIEALLAFHCPLWHLTDAMFNSCLSSHIVKTFCEKLITSLRATIT